MNIVEKKVSDLIPYEKNPRKNEKAVSKVAASIREFGFKVPIVVDKDGVIVAGHTRLLAAKELGLEEVPTIIADDLSEEQVKAFRLADNKTAEFAEWDADFLMDELQDISDIDMSEFGFDMSVFDEPVDIIEDEIPNDVPARCELGDLWQLGEHRLICGDSTDKNVINALLGGCKVDLVFTDPPYNMTYSGAGIINQTVRNVRHRIKDMVDFDARSIEFLSDMDIGSVFIFTSKDLIPEYFDIFKNWYFNILTWVKADNPPMCNNNFLPDIEYLLYFHRGKRIWNNGLRPMDIYRRAYFSTRDEGHAEAGNVHPTMKPLKLISDKLKITSNEGSVVLDLFGGSGSTLIVCEQLGRKCMMSELDPHYCDVILQRWENLTGGKAEKIK